MDNKTEQKPEYVAIIKTSQQISPDDWETRVISMKLTADTTVGQIKEWAFKNHCRSNQITISDLE